MCNSLAIEKIKEIGIMADTFIKSGLFTDIKTVAIASTKIIAGYELGLQPFQAMQGIDIIQGKTFIKPILLAGKLKASNKYDYRVITNTNEICEIEYYNISNGKQELIGTSKVTIKDVEKLGLAKKDNWIKQPDVMLYNRAMSKGIRMFCPDLYLISIYTEGDEWFDKKTEETTFEVIEQKPATKPIEIKNEGVEFAKMHQETPRRNEDSKPIKDVTNKIFKFISDKQKTFLFVEGTNAGLKKLEISFYLIDKFNTLHSKEIFAKDFNNILESIKNGAVKSYLKTNKLFYDRLSDLSKILKANNTDISDVDEYVQKTKGIDSIPILLRNINDYAEVCDDIESGRVLEFLANKQAS